MLLLQLIIDEIFVGGKNESTFCKELNNAYAVWVHNKLRTVYNDPVTLEKVKDLTKSFYVVNTFRQSIKELALGYCDEHNVKIEGAVYRYWQTDYYADCSFSTIQHKMGPSIGSRKTVLNASDLHIGIDTNYGIGGPRLMPQGGESYAITMQDIAACMANNMRKVKYIPDKLVHYADDNNNNVRDSDDEKKIVLERDDDDDEEMEAEEREYLGAQTADGGFFQFRHYLNIDRGTQSNPVNVRNALMHYLKKELGLKSNEYIYTNNDGVTFDFRYYYVIVGQELFHLFLRASDKHIWNWRHSDCVYVVGAFQAVVKIYQEEYDINETPDVLSDNVKDPYAVYKYCEILHEDFDLVQQVIITWLRFSGINVYCPGASEYIGELAEILYGKQLYDEDDDLNAKGVVSKFLCWCYDHLTPRSVARFESVKYFSIMKYSIISMYLHVFLRIYNYFFICDILHT